MHLDSLHTYPVKSCHRLDHHGSPVTVEPWGLAGDRRWLIVDPAGVGITQREEPTLATINPAPGAGGGLTLRAAGAPELPVAAPTGEPHRVRVHRDELTATPAGSAADEWLTGVLGRPARLMWLDDPARRPVDPAYGTAADRVSFADAYPLLLTNTASLGAVNDWLRAAGSDEGPLPMTRFRPNLVIAAADPWVEDSWLGGRLAIGAVTFRVVKACGRCVMTTTDQETGVRGKEPLRTLARHRTVNQKVIFGVNAIPDPPYGEITAGDPVTLLD